MNNNYGNQTALSIVLQGVFSFFLAFFVFCSVVLATAGIVTTSDYAKYQIKNSKYIELALSEIESNLSAVAIPGGLPEDFFKYGITRETFDNNIYAFIDSAYKNNVYTADDTAFFNEVSSRLYAYADEHAPGYSEETRTHLTELAQVCTDRYMQFVTPSLLRYFGNYCGRLSVPAFIASLFAATMAALSVFFLLRIKAPKIRYRTSLLSTALLISVLPLCVLIFGGIDRLGIISKAQFAFVEAFIKFPLVMLILISACMILVLLICGISARIKSVKKRQ